MSMDSNRPARVRARRQGQPASWPAVRAMLCVAASALVLAACGSTEQGPVGTAAPGSPAYLPAGKPVGPRSDPAMTAARQYAKVMWDSIMLFDRGSAFPADKACIDGNGVLQTTSYTFIANVAAYIWSITAARDLGFVAPDQAQAKIGRLLDAIASAQEQARLRGAPGGMLTWAAKLDGAPDGNTVSSVDNAWLAAALALAKQAYPPLAARAGGILAAMRFDSMLDPVSQQFRNTFDLGTATFSAGTYGVMSESRLISYVAIGLGQVPRTQYFHLTRVPEWSEPAIDGSLYRTYEGVPVYEGIRKYANYVFVPTGGGSVFEAFSVPVLIPEAKWGTGSWARSHPNQAKAQIQYGLANWGGYWGFSPASIPADGGYTEYGAPPMAVATGYSPLGEDVARRAGPVVSPYSAFLMIEYEPQAVIDNIKRLVRRFPTLQHPQYGFMDSVDVQAGTVSRCMLLLDQGLSLGALANYLTGGKLRGYIEQEWGYALQPLLGIETFSIPAP